MKTRAWKLPGDIDAHTKTEKAAVLARFPRSLTRINQVSPEQSAEMVRLTDYGCLPHAGKTGDAVMLQPLKMSLLLQVMQVCKTLPQGE